MERDREKKRERGSGVGRYRDEEGFRDEKLAELEEQNATGWNLSVDSPPPSCPL